MLVYSSFASLCTSTSLIKKEVEVITEDGAPTGRKDFIIWQPSPIDLEDPSLGRQSSITEGTRLMRFLMTRGIRVIMFCKVCHTIAIGVYPSEVLSFVV